MNHYLNGRTLMHCEQYIEAEKEFSKGRLEGDIRCIYGLMAVRATQGIDYAAESNALASVFKELENMANQGDASAAFIIGRCYETGCITEVDPIKAIEYYTYAAASEDSDALFNLGCMYMQLGSCGHDMARKFYKRAADCNHPRAIKALQHLSEQKQTELLLKE